MGVTGARAYAPAAATNRGEAPREGPADDSRPPRAGGARLRGSRRSWSTSPTSRRAPWPALTGARLAELARAQACGLDRLGVGLGERVAIVSQNSARLLTAFCGVSGYGRVLVPINFRLSADEVALHRRALRRVGAARRSRARRRAGRRHRAAPLRDRRRERRGAVPVRRDAAAVGRRRGRDRDHQLHERHHRAPEGRAAHAPQPLDQRGHVRLARRRERPRRVPAHVADVPLQRLGHDVRRHRAWAARTSCCARSTAPRSCAASTRTA